MKVFSFITPQHQFYPKLEHARLLLAADPRYARMMQRLKAGGQTTVRILLRGRRDPNHGLHVKSFYLSFQYVDASAPLGFRAMTFDYSVQKGRVKRYEFPRDPYLRAMEPFFHNETLRRHGCTTQPSIDILRYVPRHRLVFRAVALDHANRPVIGKFMRPFAFKEAYARLVTVSQTVTSSSTSFSVAHPIGIDEQHGLFFQEQIQGTVLSHLLNEKNYRDLLHTVGAIHRDLHGLHVPNVPNVPDWDVRGFLQDVEWCTHWVSFLRPESAPFLQGVRNLLVAHVPHIDPSTYTLCHGDFSIRQILKANDRWGVVDFDVCLRGDPYLEIAMVMTFLKYHVPFLREYLIDPARERMDGIKAAGEAYLNGYQERAQLGMKQKRLLWYRLGCEIQCLARMLRRDQCPPTAFERIIRLIDELQKRFQLAKGGSD